MGEIIWFLMGFIFCTFYERISGRKKEKKEINPPVTNGDNSSVGGESNKEEGLDPMSLRNGFGVTRDKNPTYAEQWVNIMNFDGTNQKEEDYGPGEDNSAEDMG